MTSRTHVVRVSRWGDSLAIRLPGAIVEALCLDDGDDVEITITDERKLAVRETLDRSEPIRALDAFRGRLPADFRFVRDEANER